MLPRAIKQITEYCFCTIKFDKKRTSEFITAGENHMLEENHAQGWHCVDLQLGMMIYDLFLTTSGEIYCLSNKDKWGAKKRELRQDKGLFVELIEDATFAAVDAATDFSSDVGTLKERLASDKRNCVLSYAEVEEFFVGETGWGFSKRRAGIYLRPEYHRKLPGFGSPRALSLSLSLSLSQNPNHNLRNSIMNGWCEALGIPCSFLAVSGAPDPVWLEGPDLGQISQSAADAFAWMAENVEKNTQPPPPRNSQVGGSDEGQSNTMATLSAILGGLALLVLFCSFCMGIFVPLLGMMFTCLLFPMAIGAIVLGILGILNANKRQDKAGKVPAFIGLGLGAMVLVMGCAGFVVLPFFLPLLHSIIFQITAM